MSKFCVGFLIGGKFVCKHCVVAEENEPGFTEHATEPVWVSGSNMGQYSQRCSRCKQVVVRGNWLEELFKTESHPSEFCWQDMRQLLVDFDAAVRAQDWEVAASKRRDMYERALRAIMDGALRDGELVHSALRRVMETETRWA